MGWSPRRIPGDHGCSAPPETSSSKLLPFLNFLHVGFETGPVPVPADKTVSGMRTALTPLTAATYKRLSLLSRRSGCKERRAASIGFVFHLVVPPTKTAASNDRHRLHTLFHCLRLLRKLRQQTLDLLHDGLDLLFPSDGQVFVLPDEKAEHTHSVRAENPTGGECFFKNGFVTFKVLARSPYDRPRNHCGRT